MGGVAKFSPRRFLPNRPRNHCASMRARVFCLEIGCFLQRRVGDAAIAMRVVRAKRVRAGARVAVRRRADAGKSGVGVVDTRKNRDYVSPSRRFLRTRVRKTIATTRRAQPNSASSIITVDVGFVSPEGLQRFALDSTRHSAEIFPAPPNLILFQAARSRSRGTAACLSRIRPARVARRRFVVGAVATTLVRTGQYPRSPDDRSMFDH